MGAWWQGGGVLMCMFMRFQLYYQGKKMASCQHIKINNDAKSVCRYMF